MRTPFLVAMLLISCGLSSAQTEKVLWNFGSIPNDGFPPVSDLVFDHAGNLYGTTAFGGNVTTPPQCGLGCGTLFELSPKSDGTWSEKILYNFCSNYAGECLDGANPWAGLVFDTAGNLYGTTAYGGNSACPITSYGCGTIFKLSPPSLPGGAWTESVLYTFCPTHCADGALPFSQLALDNAGNLYGTALDGGRPSGGGTIFELSPGGSNGWAYTVLHSFCMARRGIACPDGYAPQAGVTLDKAGSLYGTTQFGGAIRRSGGGTLYKLSRGSNNWVETVLLSFLGENRYPLGTVSIDGEGNLYSTLSAGTNSQGAVFRFNPTTGAFSKFAFNGSDGGKPKAGVFVDALSGGVYGTTFGTTDAGNVFKIGPRGVETILHTFCQQQGCTDGSEPATNLTRDKSGNLYGTADSGGAYGNGVVFEIIP